MAIIKPKILHLVLTGHWYDKIASGEKTSEYRECKPYWNKRLVGCGSILAHSSLMATRLEYDTRYHTVVFHKGYTPETMAFEINGFFLIQNMPNDLNSLCCWEIKLGKRIK